ncbi:MAG TPA: TatD family hydrolase [Patescibacteria group bacterium]
MQTMNIIDTHVHYNMDPLYANWRAHWQKAQEHGVKKSIVVGTNLETSQRAVEIAHLDQNLFAAIGEHPYVYTSKPKEEIAKAKEVLTSYLDNNPSIIALGETGLDYFRLPTDESRHVLIEAQQLAFRMHIELALQHHRFLIVHVRDQQTPTEPTIGNAYWDALAILQEYYPQKNTSTAESSESAPNDLGPLLYDNANYLIERYSTDNTQPQTDFVLHCISGPMTYIEEAMKLGAYFGVAGNVTYKSAESIRDIVKRVPRTRLLLETDAPFLPPHPYRGQQCEPWMVSETGEYINSSGI